MRQHKVRGGLVDAGLSQPREQLLDCRVARHIRRISVVEELDALVVPHLPLGLLHGRLVSSVLWLSLHEMPTSTINAKAASAGPPA